MSDDIRDIAAFYDGDPEREHDRLARHQLEFELTWRWLERHLPPAGSILEVGAATGRYTLELARRGYRVTAVDLSAGLLERCRTRLTEAGLAERVRFVVADARDLGSVAERDFDAVLLMGPLYHLIEASDRKRALRRAFGRLRPGGILFSAFISRLGVLGDLMTNAPDWIEDRAHVRSVLARGHRPDDHPRGGFRGYLARPEEIAPLHEAVGFETLALAGVEPAIGATDELYNRLEGERRGLWLELLLEVSAEPSTVGASRHLLYVGRRGS